MALKGGSNNFGVVTSFEYTTFPQGLMWGGLISYASTAYPQIVKAFNDFSADEATDEQAHLIAGASFMGGVEYGVTNIYYTKDVVAPPSLKPFTQIQPQLVTTLGNDTLLGFVNEQSSFSTNGARQLYFTTCFKLDIDFMLHVHELWIATQQTIATVPGITFSLVHQPLTKDILQKSKDRSANSLGLSPYDGPLVITLLNTVHSSASDDMTVVNAVLELIDQIDSAAQQAGKSARYRFTNYRYKTQKILEGYGQASLNEPRKVSAEYDPHGFFQKNVPGGFKLSKSQEQGLSRRRRAGRSVKTKSSVAG